MKDKGPRRSILLVGYGNTSRRDDGVAAHIIERLFKALGYEASLEVEDQSLLPCGLGAVFVHQLAPELAERLAAFDAVVFIDAHVEGVPWEPVAWRRIEPALQSGMSGHHLKPSMVLALCEALYGHCPEAYMLSVLGHDFDFGETLTKETSALADRAVEHLLAWIATWGITPVKGV